MVNYSQILNYNYYSFFDLTIINMLSCFTNYKLNLTLCDWFNEPVNNFPDSIIYLTFGNKFNHPIDNL